MKIRFSSEKRIFDINTDAIPYLSFEMLDSLGVPNLYSTRFESYDAGRGAGVPGIRMAVMKTDDLEEASPVCRANRDRLARQIGSSLAMELVTDQKHTNYVHVATREADLGIATVGSFALHRSYVDGIVTNIPDALLTAFGGDCPPVYIVDPVRKCAGLVHAGWKGTLGKIPQVAVAQMTVHFGCDPSDMYAAIGPGVCRDCYEMGDEVYDAFAVQWGKGDADKILKRYAPGTESEAYFQAKMRKYQAAGTNEMNSAAKAADLSNAESAARGSDFGDISNTESAARGSDFGDISNAESAARGSDTGDMQAGTECPKAQCAGGKGTPEDEKPEGKYHLDLREANLITLLEAGIPADHIAVSNVCTMCNSDVFYSYRSGRMENEQVAMLVNRYNN